MTGIWINLKSEKFMSGNAMAAMAEIVPRPGFSKKSGDPREGKTIAIGINTTPPQLQLAPGEYTVRIFLPNGEVLAEAVDVIPDTTVPVDFEIPQSPREWLGWESLWGQVQTLPTFERLGALESMRKVATDPHVSKQLRRAMDDVEMTLKSIEQISKPSSYDFCDHFVTRVVPGRAFPTTRLDRWELAHWWTGWTRSTRRERKSNLLVEKSDEQNTKFILPFPGMPGPSFFEQARSYAMVRDPIGNCYYAVFPHRWPMISERTAGAIADAYILLTVAINTAMRGPSDSTKLVCWRCIPCLNDPEAMSFFAYLNSDQIEVAQAFLGQTQKILFEKWHNPIAAAAVAYTLLGQTSEANSRRWPAWREWVGDLHTKFPHLPDGAIAMALLYLREREQSERDEHEFDIETLRDYALQAVDRGLPYFTRGVRLLTEILMLVVQDDRNAQRVGDLVNRTALAYGIVQQLGRAVVPGEFFTVIRLW